ncbi:oxygenase MpaB family protein [Rhodococcus sp. CH91]|uniref:oxygenase MpaB family protein n=1 Tax=Rhodococcus sp. CH91 TaxID=2910256 RepID=UPI001F4AA62E|nr:oxygenase MpaB family protein [Rhodococcus sp. CH91]
MNQRRPDATVRGVVGEAVFLLSSPRRFLTEIALPPVGHGVVEHSRALIDPVTRFRNTSAYIFLLAFGDDEERRRVVRFVNRAHAPVRSSGYNAFDPKLQLWIAAVMFHGGRDIYERFFGPLERADAERLYREFALYGTSLQVPADMWPADLDAFEAYWDGVVADLVVDDTVRTYARALLSGGDLPFVVRPAMAINRFFTLGMLDPRVREAYGFSWTPGQQRRFDRVMKVAAPLYRALPQGVRHLPGRLVLRDARRRFAGAPERAAA